MRRLFLIFIAGIGEVWNRVVEEIIAFSELSKEIE
jgi:hypothetical protein